MFDRLSRLGAYLYSLGLFDESHSINKFANLSNLSDADKWSQFADMIQKQKDEEAAAAAAAGMRSVVGPSELVDIKSQIESGEDTIGLNSEYELVGNLKTKLKEHGYLKAEHAHGDKFDHYLYDAVVEFQENNDIKPADGRVGKNTLAWIESAAANPAGKVAGQGDEKPIPGSDRSASSMEASDEIMKDLAGSEGYRGTVYDDSRKDPDGTSGFKISSWDELEGHPTIGYGHLIRERERPKFEKYLKGKSVMSKSEAWSLYEEDVKKHERWKTSVNVPITQAMFDAMLSFAFNTGPSETGPIGKVLAPLNRGDYMAASEAIRVGPKTSSGKYRKGLERRRNKEADMFLADGIPKLTRMAGRDLNGRINKISNLLKAAVTGYTAPLEDFNQGDETQPMVQGGTAVLPPRARAGDTFRSPSEDLLNNYGIDVIKYIAGTDAVRRGEGELTVEGNIYEVMYDGKRAVAKVLPASSPEPDVWRKIMNLNLPSGQARHLPKIYDIIEDRFDKVIIMEVLEPFEGHLMDVLRTKSRRLPKDLIKSEEFVHDAVSGAFSKVIEMMRSGDIQRGNRQSLGDDIVSILSSDLDMIRVALEGALLRGSLSLGDAGSFIKRNLLATDVTGAPSDPEAVEIVSNEIQKSISLYFEAANRPIPKYYSPERLDQATRAAILSTPNSSASEAAKARAKRRLQALKKERDEQVYSSAPEGFLYSEKYMPETEGVFGLLKTLKENGITWVDVHAKNLMQRPGSREAVLIDVGLYELSR